jgi:hypothetical protein
MPARLPPGGLLTKKTSNERGLMSTTIVSQNSIQSKPSLPPGNALKEFYGTPELYGKSIGYVCTLALLAISAAN